MLTNSPRRSDVSPFTGSALRLPQRPLVLPLERRSEFSARQDEKVDRGRDRWLHRGGAVDELDFTVEISPPDIVKRRRMSWDGMAAEIVQATRRERIESRFHAPVHLLVLGERGARREGETSVEGLPRSSLRDYRRKLTFVPAGHEYYDWQLPRTLTRVVHFYLHPDKLPVDSAPSFFTPRLFLENAALWDTAIKLASLIENPGSHNRLYFEALGVVLAHELVRLGQAAPRTEPQVRGGLAAWQERIVVAYIEEHLDEQIPLATLAELVRLSPYYFCRAFKQSFGKPPHRYHTRRRIEHAKELLAKPSPSVTDIGVAVGFSETSSFTAAFRKATGLTPTAYHRSLA
jgi:AraC family transcriptional regulator